jgi:hypothetical protein
VLSRLRSRYARSSAASHRPPRPFGEAAAARRDAVGHAFPTGRPRALLGQRPRGCAGGCVSQVARGAGVIGFEEILTARKALARSISMISVLLC